MTFAVSETRPTGLMPAEAGTHDTGQRRFATPS